MIIEYALLAANNLAELIYSAVKDSGALIYSAVIDHKLTAALVALALFSIVFFVMKKS